MHSSVGFVNFKHPSTYLVDRRNDTKTFDDGLTYESTDDCFNFMTQDTFLTVSGQKEKTARTTRTILWADVKKDTLKMKEKRIDKLLRKEFKKQDDLYRLQVNHKKFESNLIDENELSDSLVNNNGEIFNETDEVQPVSTKDKLRIRLQAEFRIGDRIDTERKGTTDRPDRKESRTYYRESKDGNQLRKSQQKSYSKKFRVASIESRSRVGLSTYRSLQRADQSIGDPQQSTPADEKDLKKAFVADVVESLKSGKSINLKDYEKTSKAEPRDLYLNLKQLEAEYSSRMKYSATQGVSTALQTTNHNRFDPGKPICNLPADLHLQMQTFNDFYRATPSLPPVLPSTPFASTPRDSGTSESNRRPDSGLQESEALLRDKSQTLTQMVKAVRKVQLANSAVRGFKDLEKARLRERQSARQAESGQYSQMLKKMEELVQNREEEENKMVKEKEMKERLKEEAEQRKLLRVKREMEEKKIQARMRKEEMSRVNPRLLDKYSSRRVTCITPYKSYWLKCIENCLDVDNLFSERRPSFRGDKSKDIIPETPQAALDFEVGYYRVTISKALTTRFSKQYSLLETEPWNVYPQYMEYQIPERNDVYLFEFDHLMNCLYEESHSENNQHHLGLTLGNISAPPSKRNLASGHTKKRLKNLEAFALMFNHVDSDVTKEYQQLFEQNEIN